MQKLKIKITKKKIRSTPRVKILLLFIILISLSACSKTPVKPMDKQSEDGKYYYTNKDLGFKLTLGEEFIYYQTQRKKIEEVVITEFFIPTADLEYVKEVPGYAKPITVAIFNINYWDNLSVGEDEKMFYRELNRNKNKVYALKFWDSVPSDWLEKWGEEQESEIINNFSLY